jgi:hypothetical protein
MIAKEKSPFLMRLSTLTEDIQNHYEKEVRPIFLISTLFGILF